MLIGGIVDTLVASQVNAINGQSCSHSHASIVARLECWDGGVPSGFQPQYNSIRQTEAHQSAIIFERVSAPVISGRKMSSVCNCAIRVLYSAGFFEIPFYTVSFRQTYFTLLSVLFSSSPSSPPALFAISSA
jgi:hypothetical protein